MTKNISVFSFFSGIGFLDLGFEKNGFEVAYANEIFEPFAKGYIYAREKMKLPLPKFGVDVCSIDDLFSVANIKKLKGWIKSERTDNLICFIGGPPCPDFSVGGKNKGQEGDNGRLSKSYVNLICQHLPDMFLFENVKGLWRTKKHRAFYEELKQDLSAKGYVLTERLINSIQFGAPQDRDRIILIGFRKSVFANKEQVENFDKLFQWESQVKYKNRSAFEIKYPLSSSNKAYSELTVEHWFNKNKVHTHPNQKHAFIPRAGLAKFKVILEGDVSRKSYKRLHRHRYSPTAAYGNNEVHIHPTEARRISAAEALAIQSLPKEYQLPQDMTLTNMFKAIGNGVPYLAASGLAKSIKKTAMELGLL